jgi:hypothetical protein
MAARTRVLERTRSAMSPSRALPCAVLLAAGALVVPWPSSTIASAQSPVNPVFLPGGSVRSVDAGPSGWTASAQVTATGCGEGACPVASGSWVSGAPSGGALSSSLSGATGHAGQALVTWRSPVFVVPPGAEPAAFGIDLDAAYAWTPSVEVGPTYTVRLVDTGSGVARTIVDSFRIPTPDQGWQRPSPVPLPAGALVPGATERLEISVRFTLSPRAGDATVTFDNPTLLLPPTPPPSLGPVAVAPTTPNDAATPETTVTDGLTDAIDGDSASAGADAVRECLAAGGADAPSIAVIGAAARARRVTVDGIASQPAGTPVDLLSTGGWTLGHAAVDAHGHFSAAMPEPHGSAGTTRVVARLDNGERSRAVTVQRKNVLQMVRRTGSGVVVAGAVAPSVVARGRLALQLEVPAADPCEPKRLVTATKVRVNRRTGRYSGVIALASLAATTPESAASSQSAPAFVRARVTRSGAGMPRIQLRSQMIFGPISDRRGT